jgi:hypothetical protein
MSYDERTYLVNCTQARCQVCLDLNWGNFPDFVDDDDPSVNYRTRHILTSLCNLKANRSSCVACNLLYSGIELAGRRLIEPSKQTPSPLCYPDTGVDIPTEIEVLLRPNFTVVIWALDLSARSPEPEFPSVEFYTEPKKTIQLRLSRNICT